MKKFLAVAMMLGLCSFFMGCEKKADDAGMVEEDVVVEEVQPAPAEEAPAEEAPAAAPAEGQAQ